MWPNQPVTDMANDGGHGSRLGIGLRVVSVVIPVRNASSSIGETLVAITALGSPVGWEVEVIVSDDGSEDDTVARAEAVPGCRVVNGLHSGPSGARNRGVHASRGELLLFVDGDDVPLDGWLDQAVAGFVDGDVGLVTWPAVVSSSAGEPPQTWFPNRYGPDGVLGLAGCFALPRTVFDAIGGYDEVLRNGENTDVCDRARRYCAEVGLAIRRCPQPTIRITFGQPAAHYDRFRLEAQEHLLARDGALFASDPVGRAKAHAIAAVNAGRCGEWGRARRHAWKALQARPSEPANLARLLLTFVPPLARRRWLAADTRTRVSGPTGVPVEQ